MKTFLIVLSVFFLTGCATWRDIASESKEEAALRNERQQRDHEHMIQDRTFR